MKTLCFCATAVLLIIPVLCTDFTDCGSDATITGVDVTGCQNPGTCTLKRGTKATITIKFTSKTPTTSLSAKVHGIISGVPFPFSLPEPDACSGSGISCPIASGQGYVYTKQLDIKTEYPEVTVTIKWELQGDNGSEVACVKIPAKLV